MAEGEGALRVARFLTRRARLIAVVWVVLLGLLVMQGRNVDRELSLRPVYVEGSPSKRAHDIAARDFGNEYAVAVALQGPGAAVDRQGRRLAEGFAEIPHALVVSPWGGGPIGDELRPSSREAALIVRFDTSAEVQHPSRLLRPIERRVDEAVTRPVRASIAGYPAVADSLFKASEHAVALGELIALPVLVIVLLFVFRSVLAALLPLVMGGTVVAASRGILSLLLGLFEIELTAISTAAMIGLALGVDYSLLVVSRFRQEWDGGDVAEAVQSTVRATARSVLPAGCGLLLAMAVSMLLIPTAAGRSASVAVIVVTALSMLMALVVVPALLTLFGSRLDRWSLPPRRAGGIAPVRSLRRLSGSPRAVVAILLALLFFSAWAFTLNTRTASIAFLPAGDSHRRQQEEVEKVLGPGWIAPMEVIMHSRSGPITSTERLRALAAFQHRVEQDPGVQAVTGFAKIARGAGQLAGIEQSLADQERGLDRLGTGIERVHDGSALNTSGLLAAAEGARKIGFGIGATSTGAGLLADSLQAASTGSTRLVQGLGHADEGSGKLARGTSKASNGAGRLREGLDKAGEGVDEIQDSASLLKNAMRSGDDRLAEARDPLQAAGDQLNSAWQALQRMTTGRSDPEYAAALQAVEEANRRLNGTDLQTGEQADPADRGVEKSIERAEGQFGVGLYLSSKLEENGRQGQKGIDKLTRASARLDRGLRRLAAGSRQVSDGIARLTQGGEKLSPAMVRLSDGAESLSGALGQLEAGTGQLSGGLGGGAQRSKLLTGALRRIGLGLESGRESSGDGSQLGRLRAQSPGLFRSRYLVLAGLDGSPPERRRQLSLLVDLDRGGQDARMLVIPRYEPTSDETRETKDRLEADAAALGRETGTEVVVGGIASRQIAANDELRDDAPRIRIALSLVSFLILLFVTRSLAIAAMAALLNLITVGASFGLLALLFNGSLLGGPGYIEVTTIPATMIVMFGLAIDYEVFVFSRMREEYVRTGSPSLALKNGLDQTAPVVTGAALIMISVFLAFSVSTFIPIRNFGVGQALGVFIDAFIIRLVVIPAAMTWLGERGWWMPRWLDRLLPGRSLAAAAPLGSARAR